MTRQEFIDNVTLWGELLEVCYDYDCDICEDIINDEQYDEYIEQDIYDRDCSWRELRDCLCDVEDNNYYYYRRNGWLDYEGLNEESDFREYKDRVLEWMDDWENWDYDDEEEDEDGWDDEEDEEVETEQEDEYDVTDFDVESLVTACQSHLQKIYDDRAREEEEEYSGAADAINHILASV